MVLPSPGYIQFLSWKKPVCRILATVGTLSFTGMRRTQQRLRNFSVVYSCTKTFAPLMGCMSKLDVYC
jgi:hypothetical protein